MTQPSDIVLSLRSLLHTLSSFVRESAAQLEDTASVITCSLAEGKPMADLVVSMQAFDRTRQELDVVANLLASCSTDASADPDSRYVSILEDISVVHVKRDLQRRAAESQADGAEVAEPEDVEF